MSEPEKTGKRLEKSLDLDATVDQVWEAVSTGHGMATWFVPHEIVPPTDQDETPEAEADFGSGNVSKGRVLAWDPPRYVKYGGDESTPTQVLEFFVESADGGGATLRLVQSGVLAEDWEMEYHSYGWDLFFGNLTSYFKYFAPARSANALVMGFTGADGKTVWDRFHAALGTNRDLKVGDRVDLTPDGLEPIRGEIDLFVVDSAMGIRTADGLYRFGGAGSDSWGMVNSFHYRYGVDVDETEWTKTWQDWLNGLFPPEEAPAPPPGM